ncbi:hypothetical protein PBAL39_14539 [Pedobacter sp. BAL39]|nr:hypothetical protein PBAL39_14539 [Pedobacter sp. BAL39]
MAFSHDILVKDLDGDALNDTVSLDRKHAKLLVRLSRQDYKKLHSLEIKNLSSSSSIDATKNGFEFHNDQMRDGYSCHFRFNPIEAKMQLIGMTRYNDGNAQLDGSGESSVNLLTGRYIGNWNYFDLKKQKLIKMATISQPFKMAPVYLDRFGDQIPEQYRTTCESHYTKNKPVSIN